MRLSVVIPCRNEEGYIQECIEAIYHATLPENLAMHVFVVDGMSDDDTRAIVQKLTETYSTLHLVDNTAKVTPFAFNIGIHQIPADYIQIIGARQIISSEYISKCFEILQSDPSIWCVGGRLINQFNNSASRIIAMAMDTSFGMGLGNFRILEKSGYTDTVTSPMYPYWVFEKIGFFDEQLVRNQDDDFNFRVKKEGGKIWFEHSIFLKYVVRGSYSGLFRQFFQYGYWKVFVNKKHEAITTFRQLIPPLFVLFIMCLPLSILSGGIMFYFSMVSVCMYILLALYFGVKKASKLNEFFGIVKTFPILHFSYGLGYLLGILHFIVLGKKPSGKQKRLSR